MALALALALPAELPAHVFTARELARTQAATPVEATLSTGVEAFDRTLGGGLRRGETVELVAGRSSGAFSLLLAVLAGVTAAGETAAYVDLGDGLDPAAAAACGVDLDRLLWVRPRRTKEALMSAEAIVATGMPLVVVDLGLPPVPGGRGIEAAWLRLARAARDHRTALLVAAPYRTTGTAAEVVLGLRQERTVWRLGGPPLLVGIDGELERTRERRRPTLLRSSPGARSGTPLPARLLAAFPA